MTHEMRLWIFPILAMIAGALLFATSKDKWATIGGHMFVCGFFIVLWFASNGIR